MDFTLSVPELSNAPRILVPRPRSLSLGRSRQHLSTSDREAVSQVASWAGLDVQVSVRLAGASRGDNIVAETSAGPVLIKRYKETVTKEMIEHEHSVLRRLESAGFPSPRLVRSPGGSTFVEISERAYAVFHYESGYFHYHEYVWPPRAQLRFVSHCGQALASLHATLAGFQPIGSNPNGLRGPAGERERDVGWHLDRLQLAVERSSGESADDYADLRSLTNGPAADAEHRLRQLDQLLTGANPPRTVIHGDFGPYNVMFKRGEPPFIVDFEMARIDWRVIDVAKSFQQFGLTRRGLRLDRIGAMLDGYAAGIQLGADEAALLPTAWEFLSMRRAIVCMFDFSVNRNSQKLSEANKKLELAAMIRGASDRLVELASR